MKQQFVTAFSEGDVTIQPNKKRKSLAVEVVLPDGSQFNTEIKCRPVAPEDDGEQGSAVEVCAVPRWRCRATRNSGAWLLAKRENLTADEAGIALSKAEEEFWASKAGQKCCGIASSAASRIHRARPRRIAQRSRLERHYKTPEPIKVHRGFTPQKSAKN